LGFFPGRHGLYRRGTTGEAAQVSIDRYGGSGHGGQAVCDESGDGRSDVVDGDGGMGEAGGGGEEVRG